MTARPVLPAHGGGLDAAIARHGGCREDWIDLSTGINPRAWPIPDLATECWNRLPDTGDSERLVRAARHHWGFPSRCDVVLAHGVSSLIATLPYIGTPANISIGHPTYGEYATAFGNAGWTFSDDADVRIIVHPNNPDGRLGDRDEILSSHRQLTIIDESFCDTTPEFSLADLAAVDGFVILKGIGKFWGLAGVRLGFAACDSLLADRLRKLLGPWPVSGPALQIGAEALGDGAWINETRARLRRDASRLDALLSTLGFRLEGGTDLFRLYRVGDADAVHEALAKQQVLTRVFDHSTELIRFGLPGSDAAWSRLEEAARGLA